VIGWFNDLLTPGGKRVSAAVLLIAAGGLALTCVILALAAYKGRTVSGESLGACSALAAVAGYAYGKNKDAAKAGA
jgi:hypothetical protein